MFAIASVELFGLLLQSPIAGTSRPASSYRFISRLLGCSLLFCGAVVTNGGQAAGAPYSVEALLTSKDAMVASSAGHPRALATADFDEDGVPDLLAGYSAHTGDSILLFHGENEAFFPTSRMSASPNSVRAFTLPSGSVPIPTPVDFLVAGDFDADGHFDAIASARGSMHLWLIRGDGTGRFSSPEAIKLPGRLTALAVGEINRRDGLADVAAAVSHNSETRVLVFEGPSGAVRSKPESFSLPDEATALAFGDLDGGEGIDLAIAAGRHLVILHGRDRKLSLGSASRASVSPAVLSMWEGVNHLSALAVGDFQGDGQNDLALLKSDGQLEIVNGPLHKAAVIDAALQMEQGGPIRVQTEIAAAVSSEVFLIPVRMTASPGLDLLVIDAPGARAVTFSMSGRTSQLQNEASVTGKDPRQLSRVGDLSLAGLSTNAVLPMRLHRSPYSSLVLADETGLHTVTQRLVPTFTVNSTGDASDSSGADGICDTGALVGGDPECTLRAALNQALFIFEDVNPIEFNIPGAGPHTISPASNLPTTGNVIIDGYTQPGASPAVGGTPAVLKVELAKLGGSQGLHIQATSTVRGLAIHGFIQGMWIQFAGGSFIEGNHIGVNLAGDAAPGNLDNGLLIASSDDLTLGGTTAAARNVISGNGFDSGDGSGISSGGLLSIKGNYIGTDASGTVDLGNKEYGFVGTATTVGGTEAGAGNLISGNDKWGISMNSSSGPAKLIQGNLIGTDISGTAALGNFSIGVVVNGNNVTLGGTSPSARNVVSANFVGAFLLGNNHLVQGNYVGTDISGLASLGNTLYGVNLQADNTPVGGTAPGAGNVFSGNGSHGLYLNNPVSHDNAIAGNFIGVGSDGTTPLGNTDDGIRTDIGPTANAIGGEDAAAANIIAHNGGGGVVLNSETGLVPFPTNLVLGNSIFDNGGLAIDLDADGVTLNDSPDDDFGDNSRQNFPLLNSLGRAQNGTTSVAGTFFSNIQTDYRFEVYASSTCDPSGHGEAERFIGWDTVSIFDIELVIWSIFELPPVEDAEFVSITATDPIGNTSELSLCREMVVNSDNDGIRDSLDNCPEDSNGLQGDTDGDGAGDLCDICPADPTDSCDPNGSVGAEVTSIGANIVTPDGILALNFESSDVTTPTTISATKIGLSEADLVLGSGTALGDVLAAYDLEPDGLNFDPETILLTMVVDVSALSPEARAELTIYLQDDAGNFTPADGAVCNIVVDTANCTALISHFSVYALIAPLDTDGDGVFDMYEGERDNCPGIANQDQEDLDGNGIGDACEIFADGFES